MSKWVFNGYTFPINPEEATDRYELVESEQVPIGASKSKFQAGGIKSDRITVRGKMFGVHCDTHHQMMKQWLRGRTIGTLRDHQGKTYQARLGMYNPKTIRSLEDIKAGRQAREYEAEFIIY